MRRPLSALGACALAVPFRAVAQQQGKVTRIGFLYYGSRQSAEASARLSAFVQGLRDLGYSEGRNLVVDPSGPKDARLTAQIETYVMLSKPRENKVVAVVTRELPIMANADGESLLGNLIADAHTSIASMTRAQPTPISAAHFATDNPRAIAFNNPGSLRAPLIPAADGSITYGELFKIQPFQNDLIFMDLTGAEIKEALEQQFTSDRTRIMGVSSNFSYTWDDARPKGDKVPADTIKLNGVVVKADEHYRVVANSFLAGGSEGFSAFLKGTNRRVSLLDVEALVNYLSSVSPYTPPPVGNRITRRN